VHRRGERVGDLPQRCGRRDRETELALDVPEEPAGVLQLGDVELVMIPV